MTTMKNKPMKPHHYLTRLSCGAAAVTLLIAATAPMTACETSERVARPEPGGLTDVLDAQTGAPADLTGEACSGRRMVGRVALGASCPASPSGWLKSGLFDGLNYSDSELARYCLYEWQGAAAPTAAQIAALPKRGALAPTDWLDKDCLAVAAAGVSADAYNALKPGLHQAFLQQVGAPASLPSGGAPVRVAVLDSRPEVHGTSPNDQLGHGLGMMRIVLDLTCDLMAGPCPVTVHPYLALNLTSATSSNLQHGGFYGHQSNLARQIVMAVDAWQSEQPAANLIVNLSAGWNPAFSKGTAHPISEAVTAVRTALEYASCQGALVFAAAGNDSGTLAPNGPVEPAAWEADSVTCNASGPKPLLYSVAGVDGADKPLFNARPGGRPRLAAPGFMIAPTHPNLSLGPYTGSSPSTATITAAAALIWSQQPGLAASNVVESVRSQAVSLGEPADYCHTPPCGDIARVSLCNVAQSIYGAGAVACTTPAAGSGANPSFTAGQQIELSSWAEGTFAGSATEPFLPTGCSQLVTGLVTDETTPEALTPWYLCADEHLPNALTVPFVEPQPTPDVCGACMLDVLANINGLTLDAELLIFVAEDFASDAYAMSLDLLDESGNVLLAVDLTQVEDVSGTPLINGLAPGDSATVELVDLPTVPYHSASLNWLTDLVNPRTSSQSAVLLR